MEVAASIVGLILAGGKVCATLTGFIFAYKDAPSVAQEICDEVRDFSYALCRLRARISKENGITPLGAAATDATQLAVTLAACNVTFSQLEKIVDRLAPKPEATIGVRTRLRWTWENSNLTTLLRRIQQHKASLTLFLLIWSSESSAETENMVDSLNDLITELTVTVQAISITSSPSTLYLTPESESPGPDDPPSGTEAHPAAPKSVAMSRMTARSLSSFSSVLRKSRPYRNPDSLAPTPSPLSLRTSQRRGTQWSTYSIGSHTSVFALPFEDFQLSDKTLAEEPQPLEIEIPVHTNSLHNKEQYSLPCATMMEMLIRAHGNSDVEEVLIRLCDESPKEGAAKAISMMLVKLGDPEISKRWIDLARGSEIFGFVAETVAEYGDSHLMDIVLTQEQNTRGAGADETLGARCMECALRGANKDTLHAILGNPLVSLPPSIHAEIKKAAEINKWFDMMDVMDVVRLVNRDLGVK